MTIVYVPGDSAARSIGADEVAALIAAHAAKAGIDIELRRNGSRGALWLETLVEVDNGDGRFAYGPVTPADVDSLFANNFLDAGEHPLSLGKTESIEWLATQDRVTFTRVGIIEPLSLSQYEAHGGGARAAAHGAGL